MHPLTVVSTVTFLRLFGSAPSCVGVVYCTCATHLVAVSFAIPREQAQRDPGVHQYRSFSSAHGEIRHLCSLKSPR